MSSSREAVTAPDAPAAVGPYVHAVKASGLLYCSGQIGLDPGTGELVSAQPDDQARQCLKNLSAVCNAAGTSLAKAVKVTIYLTENNWANEVNAVYAEYFPSDPPARAMVGVKWLPKLARVEIDAVVALSD